jgi:hypothetical protein
MINNAILYGRNAEIDALTKMYALLYSAFAEVSFLKLIHTPYGLTEIMISDIQKKKNLTDKWKKCIELAFLEINKQSNLGEINNKKKKLYYILNEYIIQPSQIRNKIAHGQWRVALNNESTSINPDTTILINDINYVKIDILFQIYDIFERCVEDLIESPRKAHYNYFYTNFAELEKFIEKTKNWTFETRKKRILSTKKKVILIDNNNINGTL